MLLLATSIVTLTAMATTLWMSFYLFARGFSSKVTLRAVIALLSLSVGSYLSYHNLFNSITGSPGWKAILLVICLASWYSLTYRLMPEESRKRWRWVENGIYVLAAIAILLLLEPGIYVNDAESSLYVAQMQRDSTNLIYGMFQFLCIVFILFNLLVDEKVGFTQRGKFFLIAAVFANASVLAVIVDFFASFRMPRLIPDTLIFTGVFFLGLSVARHQTLTERRTTYQDFPVSTLSVLSLTSIYLYFAWRWGVSEELFASVVAFAVLTHGAYDLTREFLERLRFRNESQFRKHIRYLETDLADEEALQKQLQRGLNLLCRTLHAPSGFAAVRRGEAFVILATRRSPIAVGSGIAASLLACEDVSRPKLDSFPDLAWIAPSFEGRTQVAVIGIGKSNTKVDYSSGDLDLLAEVADQIGTMVSLSNLRSRQNEAIRQSVTNSHENVNDMEVVADEILDTLGAVTHDEFVKHVEDALRNLPDTIKLGQSPLAEKIALAGESHIERGKRLQELLTGTIEALKPAEKRPPEPLPRMWYNHAVLYDAYVEGVPNREIMSRLYISEGTFNRTRRNAIRGLARLLMEKQPVH